MKRVITELRLSVSKGKPIQRIFAKQFDKNARILKVSLYEGDTPYPLDGINRVCVRGTKPDENQFLNDCSIEDGYIMVELTDQMLAKNGTVMTDIVLFSNESDLPILSTEVFYIDVLPAYFDDGQVISDSEYSAILDALSKAADKESYWEGYSRFFNSLSNVPSEIVAEFENTDITSMSIEDVIEKIETINNMLLQAHSGGGGTTDYTELSNKPRINGVELNGNKTAEQLGIDIPDNYVTTDTGQTIRGWKEFVAKFGTHTSALTINEGLTSPISYCCYGDGYDTYFFTNMSENPENCSLGVETIDEYCEYTFPKFEDGKTFQIAVTDDIPTNLSQLQEDSIHRTVTDAEKTSWNSKANVSDIPTQLSAFRNEIDLGSDERVFTERYYCGRTQLKQTITQPDSSHHFLFDFGDLPSGKANVPFFEIMHHIQGYPSKVLKIYFPDAYSKYGEHYLALTSDIPDVSSFITSSVNNLVNYYKKSETYTQSEVNSLINAITTINIQVVQTLPTEDISTTTIYLLPKESPPGALNYYDEYIYVSNKWELIGTTELDLTNYFTKTESINKFVDKSSNQVLTGSKSWAVNGFTTLTINKGEENTGGSIAAVRRSGSQAPVDITVYKVGEISYNGQTLALPEAASGTIALTSDIPEALSDLADDSMHRLVTDAEKTKLNGIESGAEVNVQANWNEADSSSDAYIQNKPTIPTTLSELTDDLGSSPTHTHSQYLTSHQDISGKADIADVPTKTSDLTNDSGFLTSHQDISGKENSSNKVTSLSSSSTDTQYPSAKCVYDLIGDVESVLTILTTGGGV